jgi:integrator complex subunit 1
VLEYFLRRLASTSNYSRQSAIKAVKMLLQCFHTDDPTVIDCPDSDWLLRYLPSIPHFEAVRSVVNVQLRAACQIENCPDLIMLYIQFIADKTRDDPIGEMLEHVMDLSQLIVERTTVFAHIIPPQDAQQPMDEDGDVVIEVNENQQRTLNCLFVMFTNFLINLREYKIPQSEYPDLLLVQFADGTQCHIYLNIIHAFIILLTNSAQIPSAGQILDYWFPPNVAPPQAFHSETLEPVQILPDWLKLKMIRSSVERLVDAALQDLKPDQIVLFVQNFGTPVPSMSKLLAQLDRAVIEQFEVVSAAIMNKAYLTQLIEIQQMRGAKNGHISIQALGLSVTPADEPATARTNKSDVIQSVEACVVEAVTQPFLDKQKPAGHHSSKSKEVEEIIEMIFVPNVVPVLSKAQQARFKKLMQQLVTKPRDKPGSQKTTQKGRVN